MRLIHNDAPLAEACAPPYPGSEALYFVEDAYCVYHVRCPGGFVSYIQIYTVISRLFYFIRFAFLIDITAGASVVSLYLFMFSFCF